MSDTKTLRPFFYPVEITSNPALPPERRFFFIEVQAADAFEAFIAGRREFTALFPDHTNRVSCTRWWPHADECPSVEHMLSLKAELAAARNALPGQRAEHRRRMVMA